MFTNSFTYLLQKQIGGVKVYNLNIDKPQQYKYKYKIYNTANCIASNA